MNTTLSSDLSSLQNSQNSSLIIGYITIGLFVINYAKSLLIWYQQYKNQPKVDEIKKQIDALEEIVKDNPVISQKLQDIEKGITDLKQTS